MEVDVAVIGAGPAGSVIAALLASRGVSVAVLDRDRLPRDKVCGEFLSWDALPILDLIGLGGALDAAGSPVIGRCRVVGRRRTREFTLGPGARGVSRFLLDELLLSAAATAGAKRMDGTAAAAFSFDRGRWMVTLEAEEIQARAIVGAWGRWGRFDQHLRRAFVSDRTHRNFGFKRHYHGPHDPSVVELHSFRGGYAGVNRVERDRVNICGLVHAGRLSGQKERWDGLIAELRRESPSLDQLYALHQPAQENHLSSDPLIFRARLPVEQGIWMVGDASGVVDPLTGNGMAMAMQSALLAAPRLLRLLESPARRAALEAEYVREHRELFASRIRWSRTVAALLARPALLDAALAAAPGSAAGTALFDRTRATEAGLARLLTHWV